MKYLTEATPIEKHGDIWVKRDDMFEINGVRGGKVRACWQLAKGAKGLVCASSRFSPQASIVARVAEKLGVPCRVHMPTGEDTPSLVDAKAHAAKIIRQSPGYKSVICARAREDAATRKGWALIPWGMESEEQVQGTADQVQKIPSGVKRIVVPVAFAISLAGVLHGVERFYMGKPMPKIIGVCVSSDPSGRLDKWAPKSWREMVRLEQSDLSYHQVPDVQEYDGIRLDPVYEAKCLPYIKSGDLFWIIGVRPA